MGKTRLGFDIGSSSLKIAVLRGNEARMEEIRLPENMVDGTGAIILPHAFAQFLKQTKKELSLPRGPAALALPPSQVICRLVTMPRMTTEQLLLNLPYEFSDFIQGVADQYHCDYAVCAPAGEDGEAQGVPMMAAAAAKQTLAEYARMFAQAGLRLKTVLPQEMALIQLCQARGAGAEEFCFVDLGHQFTRITVVWRDRVQAT
ncbi:type II secretion system protein GspL, partial [Oscillibacter sp.]